MLRKFIHIFLSFTWWPLTLNTRTFNSRSTTGTSTASHCSIRGSKVNIQRLHTSSNRAGMPCQNRESDTLIDMKVPPIHFHHVRWETQVQHEISGWYDTYDTKYYDNMTRTTRNFMTIWHGIEQFMTWNRTVYDMKYNSLWHGKERANPYLGFIRGTRVGGFFF